jgi:hypothetical protein
MLRSRDQPTGFGRLYTRALFVAAIAFGISDPAEMLVKGMFSNSSLRIDPTGFIVLILYGLVEAMVFFAVGWPVGYVVVRVIQKLVEKRGRPEWPFHLFMGILVGILLLPVCAGFAFWIAQDGPSYLVRCFEFLIPMATAGGVGGYFFWRGSSPLGGATPDVFS